LSVAVAIPVVAGSVLEVHSIVTLFGHVIIGTVLSSTTIVWLHVFILPQSSVAFQVLVMVYSCGHVGEATVTSLKVTVGIASQLSVAVAVPVFAGNVLAVHSIVVLAGHVIIGAVLSSTTIVWLHVFILPQSSVAFQVLVIVYSCGQVGEATVTSL
jgi:hypothetical protein